MIAADTSVLVPALLADHEFHDACHEAAGAIDTAIGHALIETYAVLTRLPHPHRVAPAQAAEALRAYARQVLVLPGDEVADALDRMVATRVLGGSSYDGLIGLTAAHHGAELLTRDRRARAAYDRLGVTVRWVDVTGS